MIRKILNNLSQISKEFKDILEEAKSINAALSKLKITAEHQEQEFRLDPRKIEKQFKRNFAVNNGHLKAKIVFHGGCLDCVTPEKEGLITCVTCQYFNADWSKPDKSKTE